MQRAQVGSNSIVMRLFFVPNALTAGRLPEAESAHAARVLRLHEGDEIYVTDGEGVFYQCVLSSVSARICTYQIQKILPQEKTWRGRIHLAIAPTKMSNRMEWLAEKATEVGFDELSLLECRYSERRKLPAERLDKIVTSATKQSLKAWKPRVNEICKFEKFIEQTNKGKRYIAHCYSELPRNDFYEKLKESDPQEEVMVMIGPEGDFSEKEVEEAIDKGFCPISLGKSRLRTETAGLFAVMMANLVKRVGMLVAAVMILLLSACSENDCAVCVPKDSPLVGTADLAQAGGGMLGKWLLRTLPINDSGLDLDSRMWFFKTHDGLLGLCAAIENEDDLRATINKIKEKGRVGDVEDRRGCHWTMIDNAWLAAFDDSRLLMMGPVLVSNRNLLENRMLHLLKQDEKKSFKASKLYERLEDAKGSINMLANLSALPEDLAAPLMLGAAAKTKMEDVWLETSMQMHESWLEAKGKKFSMKPAVEKSLRASDDIMRPIQGRYMTAIEADMPFAMLLNVNGEAFLPLLQRNEALQGLIAGANAAIDMNNIIKSMDGDVLMCGNSNEKNVSICAELAHSKWLQDVDYWKSSCPKGGRIDDVGPQAYIYHDGNQSFYFGVTADGQFVLGPSEQSALQLTKEASKPLPTWVQKNVKGVKMLIIANIEKGLPLPMSHLVLEL